MMILQEQEGYQDDWVQKNGTEINYLQALSFFHDYFSDQEEQELRK